MDLPRREGSACCEWGILKRGTPAWDWLLWVFTLSLTLKSVLLGVAGGMLSTQKAIKVKLQMFSKT